MSYSKKFSDHSSEEQEIMSGGNISSLAEGGMSDHYDEIWVAKQLCEWAADSIKAGKPLPPYWQIG